MNEHQIDSLTGPWGARPATESELVASQQIASASPETNSRKMQFLGSRRDYARITTVGLLLYIPTLGFYRFWLKTEQRRYLWLNTTLQGDSFEYRGTARELVIGFLFALAIYLPFAAIYTLLGLYAETVHAYASVPFFLFTYAFSHFAAFRARRYRLTRTGFRGIRFWINGSGWKMGFQAFGYLLLVVITLGMAWPWMQAWLERYKTNRSYYGTVPGRFGGTGKSFLKKLTIPVLFSLIVIGACISSVAVALDRAKAFDIYALMFIFAPTVIVSVMLFMSIISAVKMRWWIGNIELGDIILDNDLRWFSFIWPALKAIIVGALLIGIWLTFGTIMVWMAIRAGIDPLTWMTSNLSAAVLAGMWSIGALLLATWCRTVFYTYDVVRKTVEATTVQGLDRIAYVGNGGGFASATGEGLADALGADGF